MIFFNNDNYEHYNKPDRLKLKVITKQIFTNERKLKYIKK